MAASNIVDLNRRNGVGWQR